MLLGRKNHFPLWKMDALNQKESIMSAVNLYVVSSRESAAGNHWAVLGVDGLSPDELDAMETREFYRAKVDRTLPKGTRLNNVEIVDLPVPAETLEPRAEDTDRRPVVFHTVALKATAETEVLEPYSVPTFTVPRAKHADKPFAG